MMYTWAVCWSSLCGKVTAAISPDTLPARRAASRSDHRHRRSMSAASMQRMLCVRAINVLLLRYVGDPARDDVDERLDE